MQDNKITSEFKQRIYSFVLRIIKFIQGLPRNQTFHVISSQLLRSGTSIGANYFEAQSASSRRDFTNYFRYFLKSANESKFWLALIRDTHQENICEIDDLLTELSEIPTILAKSIITLKGGNQ